MSKKRKQPWSVFIAIILAIIAGMAAGKDSGIFGVTFYSVFNMIGVIFINALTLVVVPLVSSSIITGIARIGNDEAFGRLGFKTFTFYLSTSLMAILIGLFFVNIIAPGTRGIEHPAGAALSLLPQETASFAGFIEQIVPSNIFFAFSQGQMLGVIFFSLLFGYAISKIESHSGAILSGFWNGIFQVMLRITHIIMKFFPSGSSA